MIKTKEELIEGYLRHELTADELTQFNSLLKDDADFAAEFKLSLHIATAVERTHEQNALQELMQVPAAAKRRHPVRNLIIGMLAAASVVLIYIGFTPYSNEYLFEKSYEVPTISDSRGPVNIPGTSDLKTMVVQGFESYQKKDYQTAAGLLEGVITKVSLAKSPEDVVFYAAISQLETGQTNAAIFKLEYLSISEGQLRSSAKWYLALAYLHKNEKGKAIELLEGLKDNSFYSEEATELYKSLTEGRWF